MSQQEVPPSGSGGPAKLSDVCYEAVTRQPLDFTQLEAIPAHTLVQLLSQAVAERDELKEAAAARAKADALRYALDVPRITDRLDDDDIEAAMRVVAKWEPKQSEEDFTANYAAINFHKSLLRVRVGDAHSWVWLDRPHGHGRDAQRVSAVISSAMLLYRACCLWPLYVHVEGWDGYKFVWTAELRHKATGEALGLSEWKGAATIYFSRTEDLPAALEDDVVELMNLLCGPRCPHPYDGTVAGSVA